MVKTYIVTYFTNLRKAIHGPTWIKKQYIYIYILLKSKSVPWLKMKLEEKKLMGNIKWSVWTMLLLTYV